MKNFIKKIYFVIFLSTILFINSDAFSKNTKDKYSRENISNYLSGIISADQHNTKNALKFFQKTQSLKKIHHNFNVQFIRTLVLAGRFDQAFKFSKEIWKEEESFFEVDLLLGLNSFINQDYKKAKKHFERLNQISQYNLYIEDFLGSLLIVWSEASGKNKNESFNFLNKIPSRYGNLKKIQDSFLKCYFNSLNTQLSFKTLIEDNDYNFARYNFFLANYLLFNNKTIEAKKIIKNSRKKYNSNLLIKQTNHFMESNNIKKVKDLFNCKDTKDVVAEIFYVLANLYATQKDYKLSNFYLQISIYLNNKFTPNKTLLAENFFFQKKYQLSKNEYNSIKKIGKIYSWYAAKNIAIILSKESDSKYSPEILEKEFSLLENPNFRNYYELANFYKDHEHYKESIKYYTLALKSIDEKHSLIPKILYQRGTSYERIDDWDKAEKDLMQSLEIVPDQPHVLNYLAYTWVDKKINVKESLKMLEKANKLKAGDGYIIDSLGWAHYIDKNYINAEFFLQKAVELMPMDPIINDHYADTLWMLNKDIQARYLWQHVLNLKKTEKKLKDDIKRKIIFGLNKNL